MSQGNSSDKHPELEGEPASVIPSTAFNAIGGAPLVRKAPPHMRRLGGALQVSSPSDNLSPCSQKLMAADLQKGVKPRPFKSLLTGAHSLSNHSQLSNSAAEDAPMEVDYEGEFEYQSGNRDTASDEDGEEAEKMPPSPTRMPGGLARGK